MKHQLLRSFVVALVLCTGQFTLADGIIRDSVEAISGGRGGTNIAHSDNGAVILSNPAGIINSDGCGIFEVGADTLFTDMTYSNNFNPGVSANNRPLALPMLSYFQNIPDSNWAAGIGIFAPAGFAAGWDLNNPVTGPSSYQSFGSLIKILPAVAYQATDRLSIGATLGVSASYAELNTPFFLQTGPLAGAPTHLDLRGMGVAPTWSTGLQYLMSDRTTLGAVYTSEDRMNLGGTLNADVYGLGPNPISSRFDSRLNIVWPQSVGVGMKHLLTDRQRVSLDLVWLDWSHAFKSFDLELRNASNPLVSGLLGPVINTSFPMNWWDSLSVRTGYEWFYTDRSTLRLGYIYNSTQLPSATLTPLIPAVLEHTFTIGHGTKFNNWRFDLAYQYSFGPQRDVATSGLIGGDFDNSHTTAQAHWLSASLTKQF